MLRVIIISDTHSSTIEKLDSDLLNEIKTADVVIHAGDADREDFISELERVSKRLYAVKGNCDWGSDLPAKLIFELDGVKIGLAHGTGNYANVIDRLSYLFSDDEVDIIIFGHTHTPINEDIEGMRFINPGSAMLNRGRALNSYAVLEIDGASFVSKIIDIPD